MKQQEVEDTTDYEWYYRDKSLEERPRLAWCATWPEGQQDGQQRVNFIGQLYFTAPDRASAIQEFRRWAELRMQDIPYTVLEQMGNEDLPRCPQPRLDDPGEAITGVWNRLT